MNIDTTTDLFAAIPTLVAWHDAHAGRDREQLGLRIAKAGQEAGEAMDAWFGHVGNNPRKGVYACLDDVVDELADTVLAALIAIESLGAEPRHAIRQCLAKCLARVAEHPAAAATVACDD